MTTCQPRAMGFHATGNDALAVRHPLVGAPGRKGAVSDLVGDALSSGHEVPLAHATSEEQTGTARRAIADSVGESTSPSPTQATPIESAGA